MKLSRNYTFWFVTGSQHLYGPTVLKQVEEDSINLVKDLNALGNLDYKVEFKTVIKSSEEVSEVIKEANSDDSCAGIIGWMHTFSPAKMWIKGLSRLQKPFVQLHTQFNRDIPWGEIDMDFMNLNQTAHGGREFGFINARLRVPRKIIVGYYKEEKVLDQLRSFMNVAIAINECKTLKVARFGDNMREVAVTEGDKVEAEIKFGWSINGYAVGDLVKVIDAVTEEEVAALLEEYKSKYTIPDTSAEVMAAIAVQAKIEIGLERFLVKGGFTAFTTTFENLYGLAQLPGLAVQRLMEKGYGFGAEGDWKTAALLRIMKIMQGTKTNGTSFMEDYTYHLDPENKAVLGAHMLEVCPSIAVDKPSIIVRPLGIGGKADPARFIFSAKAGKALNASLVDMGGRMRLIINEVEAIDPIEDMPLLPVAKAMWRPLPDFETGVKSWILSGGAHHTVFTYDVTTEDLLDFCEFMDIESVVIDKNTNYRELKETLKLNDLIWTMKR